MRGSFPRNTPFAESVSGTGEGSESWPAYSYAGNTQAVFDAMIGSYGFSENMLTQQVFTTPPGQDAFSNCSATGAPDYPHFCHAQDRDLAGEWLFGRVGP